MKVVHINETFGIGAARQQPTKYTCVPTVIKMLLNRDDVPMIEQVEFGFDWTFRNKRFTRLQIAALREPALDLWLAANNIKMTFHEERPTDKASMMCVMKTRGRRLVSGHAILCLGNFGFIDPGKGHFSINNDDPRRIAGYVTFDRIGV